MMAIDPETALKMQTTVRTAKQDQLKTMAAGIEIWEKMAGGAINDPLQYHRTEQMLSGMGLQGIIPPVQTFITKDGQLDMNRMNETIKRTTMLKEITKAELEGIKPPHTDEVKIGDKIVKRQWNKATGQWEVIGDAPRWDENAQGMIIRENPDGTKEYIMGGKGGKQAMMPNPKTAETEIYKDIMGHHEDMEKLNVIEKSYLPEYQTYGGQIRATLSNVWGKVKPESLSPEQKEYLKAFSAHRANTGNLMSSMVKRMSGTAVTDAEMKRLEVYMPKAGTGMFDGDSPDQFESKIKQFRKLNELAIARLTHWAKEGVIPDKKNLAELASKTSLDSMETILKNRGNAIKAELKRTNPNISADQLYSEAERRLRQEYNLR
jgi:hypothetical protein